MSDYEIGRDLQDLRSRVERLEESLGGRHAASQMLGMGSSERHQTRAGVELNAKPSIWESDKHVPLFINALLGLPSGLKLDGAQSKTWTCYPEPLILYVNWNAGGSDEFYRLQNQSFTIYRVTDPNTGTTTSSAWYSAQLVASGKAKPQVPYSGQLYFDIQLLNGQGGLLTTISGYSARYIVDCHDNRPFFQGGGFNPGLYDIVAGAHWQISGVEYVDRC